MCVVLLVSIVFFFFYQNVHSINSTPAGVLKVLEFELSLCLRGREGAHDQVKLIIAEEGWGENRQPANQQLCCVGGVFVSARWHCVVVFNR